MPPPRAAIPPPPFEAPLRCQPQTLLRLLLVVWGSSRTRSPPPEANARIPPYRPLTEPAASFLPRFEGHQTLVGASSGLIPVRHTRISLVLQIGSEPRASRQRF